MIGARDSLQSQRIGCGAGRLRGRREVFSEGERRRAEAIDPADLGNTLQGL